MNRYVRLASVAVIALSFVSATQAEEAGKRRISLDQALAEAATLSPVLAARRASLEEAEARLITAETYPHNPELAIDGANREGGGDSSTDWAVRLTQPMEIGGQRGRRVARASADLDTAVAGFRREERLLAARVAAVFVESLRARELLDVERANAELVQSLADVAGKRFEAGDIPQIEVNLAQAQVGRAERSRRLARSAYDVACAALAEVVGLDPMHAPEPLGELALPPSTPAPVSELLAGALLHRSDLEALRSTIEAAQARIELARREVVPDLALQAFYGREDGTDRVLGGGVAIRIPLFNRNRGAIAEARASERRAASDHEAAELRVRREVVEARIRYEAAVDVTATLQENVVGTLEDNLSLLQRSFEAGKTGWAEVLVFRREFIDSRRAFVESLANVWLASVELDLAAGRSPVTAP